MNLHISHVLSDVCALCEPTAVKSRTMIIPRARLNTPSSAPEGHLPYLQRVNQEHESIFVAIRNQDAEAARAAMRTHLSNSKERLRESQAQRLGHTMTDYAPGPISA